MRSSAARGSSPGRPLSTRMVAQRGGEARNGGYAIGEIAGWSKSAEKWVTFVLRGQAGATVKLTARHERAGTVRTEAPLP